MIFSLPRVIKVTHKKWSEKTTVFSQFSFVNHIPCSQLCSFQESHHLFCHGLTKFQLLLYFSSVCYSSSFFFIEAPTLSCQDGIGHIITINTNPFVVPHHHREGRCDVYILHIGTIWLMNEIIQKREKWSKEEQGSNHKTTPIFFICYTRTNDATKKYIKIQKTNVFSIESFLFWKHGLRVLSKSSGNSIPPVIRCMLA